MITNILLTIKNIFSWLISKLTFRDWLIILLVILCGVFYWEYLHYYTKSLTPIVVYNTDSLDMYKNKVKEEYVSKNIYVLNINDLKKLNNILSEELNKLKDNPIVITKSKLEVKIDTVYALSDTISLSDSIYSLKWHLFDPHGFYFVDGNTDVRQDFSSFKTRINEFNMKMNLTYDILDNGDDKLRLIGKSDNPYISIINMEGVVFDPLKSSVLKKYYKQKKWSIGPTVGYGLTSDFKFQPYIGIGVSYGIILF